MGSETGRMACALYPNDFHYLHNGHVDFEHWSGQLDSRRPVHCAFARWLKRGRYENHYVLVNELWMKGAMDN